MNSTTTNNGLKDPSYYDEFVGLEKELDESETDELESESELEQEDEKTQTASGSEVEKVETQEAASEQGEEKLLDEEDLAELRVADELPFHKDPKVRLVAVVLLGVGLFGIAHVLSSSFSTFDYSLSLADYKASRQREQSELTGKKDPKDEIIEAKEREIERLKTKELAEAQRMEVQEQDESQTTTTPEPTTPAANPTPKPTPQPAPAPAPVFTPRPQPVVREPLVARVEQPKPRLDPEEKWRQAAALGTYSLGNSSSTSTRNRTRTRTTTQAYEQIPARSPTQIAQPTKAEKPVLIPPGTPPGQVIVVNSRAEAKLLDDFLYAEQSVAQVELEESLPFNNGSIALPEETILLIEFNPENPPTTTAIPISKILLPVNGQYQEVNAPDGALFVRGKDNKPLKLKNKNGNRLGGLGLSDAIGVTGGVLNMPSEVTQTARRAVVGRQSYQDQSIPPTLTKGTSIEVYVYQSFAFSSSD